MIHNESRTEASLHSCWKKLKYFKTKLYIAKRKDKIGVAIGNRGSSHFKQKRSGKTHIFPKKITIKQILEGEESVTH